MCKQQQKCPGNPFSYLLPLREVGKQGAVQPADEKVVLGIGQEHL